MRMPLSKRLTGFTLIELLVVISIIAILIAILLPALGAAKKTAQSAKCLSNQKQLALATQMYHNDFNGYFPQPFQDNDLGNAKKVEVLWFNALDDFLGQLSEDDYSSASERNYNEFKQDPVYTSFVESTGETGGNGSRTIKMNQNFGNLSGGIVEFHKDISLTNSAETVVFFDGTARDMGLSINSGANTAFHGDESRVFGRHRGSANIAFADGHASSEKQETFESSIGGVDYDAWFDEPDARQELVWDFDAP